MYLGNRKYDFPEEFERARNKVIKFKAGATFNTFLELEGLINRTALAKEYFKKSHSWFSQRLHGATVCDKTCAFTEAEYHQLADALRHIAKRLEAHADEIDNAEL